MNILLLTQSYRPVLGGLQQILHDLAQSLVVRGEQIQVITQRYPRSLLPQEVIDLVPIRRFFFMSPSLDMLRRHRIDLFAFSFYAAPRTKYGLDKLLRGLRPQLIHFHYPQHLNLFVLDICQRHDLPLVVSFHGTEIQEVERGEPKERTLLRAVLDQSRCVTAVSEDALNAVIKFYPAVQGKGQVVYNGVSMDVFEYPEPAHQPRRYIIAAGRLVEPKGFQLLLRAFAAVLVDGATEFTNLDLILVGDGAYRETLETLVDQLGIREHVIFRGNLSRSELAGLTRGAHFAVMPSLAETFGLYALEAMALERRVIATRVGGLPELLGEGDSANGLKSQNQLVPVSVEGLVEAMRRWLSDPDFSPHSSLNRERALTFSLDRMVDVYQGIYKSVLNV